MCRYVSLRVVSERSDDCKGKHITAKQQSHTVLRHVRGKSSRVFFILFLFFFPHISLLAQFAGLIEHWHFNDQPGSPIMHSALSCYSIYVRPVLITLKFEGYKWAFLFSNCWASELFWGALMCPIQSLFGPCAFRLSLTYTCVTHHSCWRTISSILLDEARVWNLSTRLMDMPMLSYLTETMFGPFEPKRVLFVVVVVIFSTQ